MKLLLPILWRRALLVIVIALAVGILGAQAQSDSTDNELVFHVVKKRICEREKPQTDLMREGLKGKVKTVVTEDHSHYSGFFMTETDEYDTAGTLTASVTNSSDHKLKKSQIRIFDKNHKIKSDITRTNYYFFEDNDEPDPGHASIISKLMSGFYDFSGLRYYKKNDYQYDAKGRLIAIRSYGYARTDAGSLGKKRIHFDYLSKYDSIGQCIESDMENGIGRSLYTYDEIGNCIKRVDKPASGEFIGTHYSSGESTTTTYIYGDNCKVKEAIRLGNSNGKTIYEYDEKDSLIMQKDVNLGQVQAAREEASTTNDTIFNSYKYDDKGNKAEVKVVRGILRGTYEKSYQYRYDKKGNWTRKDEFISKQKPGYYLRKISYY